MLQIGKTEKVEFYFNKRYVRQVKRLLVLHAWKLVHTAKQSGSNRRTSPATGSGLGHPLSPLPADHLIQTKRVLRPVTHASALH